MSFAFREKTGEFSTPLFARVAIAALAGVVISAPSSADFFVSGNHSSILQFDELGGFIGVFTSGGSLNNARGVVFGPDGNMYVSSLSSNDVQRFDGTTGAFIDVFASVSSPWELIFNPHSGNLLVASFQGDVFEFDGTTGAPLGSFAAGAGAAGLTFGPNGNLFVGSFPLSSVREYDGTTGAYLGDLVSPGSGGLTNADGVTFGPDGNLYVSSRTTNQVLRYNGATGAFIDVFTSGTARTPPVDLEFDVDGNLLVVSALANEGILRYDGTTGGFIDFFIAGNGIDTPTHFTSDVDGTTQPVNYCTAKSGLLCGLPAMGFSGAPQAGASSGFTVSAAPARGLRSGLLLYSCAGRAAVPFQGGLLCVNPAPLRRASGLNSGGTNGACDGVFSMDFNQFASGNGGASGNPDPCTQVPGQQVNVQMWGRDSVATGSFLSDGLEFSM